MNKVILMGRLTRDVDTKFSQEGNALARVSIAVDRRFSKNNEADFFNLVAFGKTAEFLKKYFAKGSKILVEGRLRFSQYEDKNGDKKSTVDVIVENVEFADSKKKFNNSNDPFDGETVDDADTPF